MQLNKQNTTTENKKNSAIGTHSTYNSMIMSIKSYRLSNQIWFCDYVYVQSAIWGGFTGLESKMLCSVISNAYKQVGNQNSNGLLR